MKFSPNICSPSSSFFLLIVAVYKPFCTKTNYSIKKKKKIAYAMNFKYVKILKAKVEQTSREYVFLFFKTY